MAVENCIIYSFVDLIESKPQLFQEVRAELEALPDQLPDDVGQICSQLMAWCERHKLYEQLMSTSQSRSDLRAGGQPTRLTPEECRDLIEDATGKLSARIPI